MLSVFLVLIFDFQVCDASIMSVRIRFLRNQKSSIHSRGIDNKFVTSQHLILRIYLACERTPSSRIVTILFSTYTVAKPPVPQRTAIMGNSRGNFGILVMVMSVLLLVTLHQVHGGSPTCQKEGEGPCDNCCSRICANNKCANPSAEWKFDAGEKIIEYVADILDGKW